MTEEMNNALDFLVSAGLVVVEKDYVEFVAPILRPLAVNRIYLSGDHHTKWGTRGVTGEMLETAWQHEFFRAATICLPQSALFSPASHGGHLDSGFPDFHVNGSLQWILEFLREGSDVSGHVKKFTSTDGLYQDLIPAVKRIAILDFTSDSTSCGLMAEYNILLWRAVYSDDYEQTTLKRPGTQDKVITLEGHRHK